jgi:hypothetical protein
VGVLDVADGVAEPAVLAGEDVPSRVKAVSEVTRVFPALPGPPK